MKGVFIHNQLEFRLEVAGEDFCQGDSLFCSLAVKNHGATAQSLSGLRLELADANLKKLKEKKEDALEIVSSARLSALSEIEQQQQQSFSWTFNLDKNCTISDKGQSLCFVYGNSDAAGTAQLPFTVSPHRHIQKIVSFFESPFQFVLKGQKTSNGRVQVKLKPPTERRLSLVDELVLGFHFEEEVLLLDYLFKVKAFDTTASSVSVKKARSGVSQRLEPAQYLLGGEYLNHDFLQARVEEALAVVATGF